MPIDRKKTEKDRLTATRNVSPERESISAPVTKTEQRSESKNAKTISGWEETRVLKSSTCVDDGEYP